MSEHIRQQLLTSWTRLFGYAYSLTRDRDRAADLLQQAALRALEAKLLPEHEGAVRAWLFQLLRNVWIDQYRRERVRARRDAEETAAEATWSFDNRLIAAMTVRQGLERIDEAHREIIELVDINGFRYAEAARILGVPEGTVMSRLSRARLALLKAIGDNVVVIDNAKRRSS